MRLRQTHRFRPQHLGLHETAAHQWPELPTRKQCPAEWPQAAFWPMQKAAAGFVFGRRNDETGTRSSEKEGACEVRNFCDEGS